MLFRSKGEVLDLLQEYGIKHHKSSPYRPQTNGAVEAANKNVKNILRKITDNCKEWPSKLPFALWGYQTSIQTSTEATPYALVYGMESVLPIELEVSSLRVLKESQISEAELLADRHSELALLDEKSDRYQNVTHLGP